MVSPILNDSVFWVEVDKIKPNPFQPRKEFNEDALKDLADSIRMYGVLQPLVVTRKETIHEDGISTEYELIAGERRLRASKLAGLREVPAIIRTGEQTDQFKLEVAIIENLQREDLNPIDRAKAFDRLAKDFGYKHHEIAKKVGKSREYVSNSIRLLALPEEMMQAIVEGKISEGHARPLLMLIERPEEQKTLFKDIVLRKLNVREAEDVSRRIATDRARKKETLPTPEIVEIENALSEHLGTRVSIKKRENGGEVIIDYFSEEDLHSIVEKISREIEARANMIKEEADKKAEAIAEKLKNQQDDSELYSVTNFTV